MSIDTAPAFSIDAAYAEIAEHLRQVDSLRARIEREIAERDRRAAAGTIGRPEELSPAELRTLRLAANTPLSVPDIARQLHVSANTTKTHLKNIYRKLGVERRGELPAALKARGWRV